MERDAVLVSSIGQCGTGKSQRQEVSKHEIGKQSLRTLGVIDSASRIVNIRGLERVLKDGCLAQLVERRPYKA